MTAPAERAAAPGRAEDWELVYEGWDPEEQPLREALCTLGNGYLGTRGSAEEATRGGPHYPGTYLAGCYDRASSVVDGRRLEHEALVNAPSWLPLSFRAERGAPLDLERMSPRGFRQRLDLARGLLERSFTVRDAAGRETALESERLVHRGALHCAALRWKLVPLNWSGTLRLCAGLDGAVTNEGVPRYRPLQGRHLHVLESGPCPGGGLQLRAETLGTGTILAQAARTRVTAERARSVRADADATFEEIEVAAECGRPVFVEKCVAIHTSRDPATRDPAAAARRDLACAPGWDALVRSHERLWRQLWRRCDLEIRVAGEPRVQRDVRLLIFHLLQCVPVRGPDLDAGIPARGLHGEAYLGHVFWDELFVSRFLDLRLPEVSRRLLRYRWARLDEARRAASDQGLAGACYPWRSASDGSEVTPRYQLSGRSGRWMRDDTRLQRHVGAAIAFEICHHVEATGDFAFQERCGAEMLIEIARLWASLAEPRPDGSFSIRGVVGPDEFHTRYPGADAPGIDDNSYTNVMAAWCLSRAGEVLERLTRERAHELREQLELSEAEIAHWGRVSTRLRVPQRDGRVEPFEGFGRLRELDWRGQLDPDARESGRVDLLLEERGDDVNRYQVAKQADLLMLLYLFPVDEVGRLLRALGAPGDREALRRTIEHALERTVHGSTLSFVVHAWIQARLDRERSWQLFWRALCVDQRPTRTSADGVHIAAMAGALDIAQRGYAGLRLQEDVLWLEPRLPARVEWIRFPVQWRQHRLQLEVDARRCVLSVSESSRDAVRVGFADRVYRLVPGERRVFSRERGGEP